MNKFYINNKRSIFHLLIGVIIGALLMSTFSLGIHKTYGLSIKDYKEINQFEEFTKSYFYKDTQDIDFKEGIKKGIVESLNDPYSKYLNAKEFKKMMEDTTGNFVGIGVYIAPTQDNNIVVISPIKGSPAEKAGIKSGDIIATVDGKKYNAKTLQEAVSAMRGEDGKKVKIGIISKNKFVEKELIRQAIHPQTVASKVLENGVGYIQIIAFEEKTANEFRENLDKLKKQKIKSLIIDVRSNPGGLVDQVVDIADQILPNATIVYTNDNKNKKEYFKSDNKESLNLPLAVLVNEGSASASEILSGALQDNKKAVIVGQKTYGKGVIQSVVQLKDGSGLVITTAQYYTPNGHTVHKLGISPDYLVESKLNTKTKDAQLQKAIEVLQKSAK